MSAHDNHTGPLATCPECERERARERIEAERELAFGGAFDVAQQNIRDLQRAVADLAARLKVAIENGQNARDDQDRAIQKLVQEVSALDADLTHHTHAPDGRVSIPRSVERARRKRP